MEIMYLVIIFTIAIMVINNINKKLFKSNIDPLVSTILIFISNYIILIILVVSILYIFKIPYNLF